MPEDYQNGSQATPNAGMSELLKGLGIDVSDTNAQPNAGNPADAQDDGNQNQVPADDQGNAAQAADADDATPDGDANQGDSANGANAQAPNTLDQQKQNRAFAEMRTSIGEYEKFISHLMKATGFTGTREDFIKDMTERAYVQQAKTQGQGVDPNVLKRLDELENQNKYLEEQNNRTLFASNLKNLQTHFNLTDKELTDFVNLAVQEKIDLTIPGTNFITLYQGLNHDALVTKAIEEARQEWLGQQAKGQQTGTAPDGKSGKKDPSPTDVNTMAEFNSLLNNLPK